MNKKTGLVLLGIGVCCLTLQAQKLPPKALPNTLLRKTPAVLNNLTLRSARLNRAAFTRLRAIAQIQSVKPIAFTPIPEELKKTVFEVQHTSYGRSTATAFALEIDGKVWGVTAAHVMENIQHAPYAKIQNMLDKTIMAPIEFWQIGNKNGNDVAIFEIPGPIQPFVKVLHADLQTFPAETQTQSPCFIKGILRFLPEEKIVFTGSHRLLLQDNAHQEMSGYCGSPVLVNGKVVGLHIGTLSAEDARTANWSDLFTKNNLPALPALHVASPINRVVELAKTQDLNNPATQVGTPLKVMGKTVTYLHPREQIYSIQQLRDGFLRKTIHAHPFMNFDKLEEFFSLQENDVLRITVIQPKTMFSPTVIRTHNIDISTGKITSSIHPNH